MACLIDMDTIDSFAKRIRFKYPEYESVGDQELVERVLEKYPEYRTKVQLDISGMDQADPKPGVFDEAMRGVGRALEPMGPVGMVQSPIGQELVKPRLEGVGRKISQLVPEPTDPPTSSPLAMAQSAAHGVGELAGAAIGGLGVADAVTLAPVAGPLLSKALAKALQGMLPKKREAVAALAGRDPVAALRSALPVGEWGMVDEFSKEAAEALARMPEAMRGGKTVKEYAQSFWDGLGDLMPEMKTRPGAVRVRRPGGGDAAPEPRRDNLTSSDLLGEEHAARIAKAQEGLASAPEAPLEGWTEEVLETGERVFSNPEGYRLLVPKGADPKRYAAGIREIERAEYGASAVPEQAVERAFDLFRRTTGLPDETAGRAQVQASRALAPAKQVQPPAPKPEPDVAPWHSKLAQVLDDPKTPASMPAEGLRNVLRNRGVKEDEVLWSGMDEWLKGKGKVTKREAQRFLEENRFEVKEIELGSTKNTGPTYYTLVDPNDPALQETHFATEQEARDFMQSEGWDTRNISIEQRMSSTPLPVSQGLNGLELAVHRFTPEQKQAMQKLRASGFTVDVDPGGDGTTLFVHDVDSGDIIPADEISEYLTAHKDDLNISNDSRYEVESLVAFLRGKSPTHNANVTKYEDYQLPGGKNYREKLFQLPAKGESGKRMGVDDLSPYLQRVVNEFDEGAIDRTRLIQEFAAKDYKVDVEALLQSDEPFAIPYGAEAKGSYTSGHFDEPNILAHVRMNDRKVGRDKVLFLEEVQSDWHQAGREQGYMSPVKTPTIASIEPISTPHWIEAGGPYEGGGFTVRFDNGGVQHLRARSEAEAREKAMETAKTAMVAQGGVPNAPFKKTWHEMVMKRMIRQAVEEGKDGIAWTTGAQQAARYDLSKQVSKVTATPIGDKYRVVTFLKNGQQSISRDLTEQELLGFIGKDLALKIVQDTKTPGVLPKSIHALQTFEDSMKTKYNTHATWFPQMTARERAKWSRLERAARLVRTGTSKDLRTYTGLDLQVGGEGMKGFYDKILPEFVNKFAKKWGAKVEQVPLEAQKAVRLPATDKAEVKRILNDVRKDSYWGEGDPADELREVSPRLAEEYVNLNVEEELTGMGRDPYARSRDTAQFNALFKRLIEVAEQGPVKKDTNVHYLKLTPELKRAAMKQGFPLFSGAAAGAATGLAEGRQE